MKNKKLMPYLITAVSSFVLFLVLIIALKTIDIKTTVEGAYRPSSSIGLSTINIGFSNLIEYNKTCYNLSNVIEYLSIAVMVMFFLYGFISLVKTKSLKAVDEEIVILGGLYTILLITYVAFEFIAINYRPVSFDFELEPSFPSSHTMLVFVVMGSAYFLIDKYVKNKNLTILLKIVDILLIVLMITFRVLSGVHWITDVVGGILISLTFVCAYKIAIEEKQEI